MENLSEDENGGMGLHENRKDVQLQSSSSSSPPVQVPAELDVFSLQRQEFADLVHACKTVKGKGLHTGGVIPKKADNLLKKLEEFNEPHYWEMFLTAMEGQLKDWELFLEDLARVEGLLTRWDQEGEDRLKEAIPTYDEKLEKVSRKMQIQCHVAFQMDSISDRAKLLNRFINSQKKSKAGAGITSHESNTLNFNLCSRFLTVHEEILRRTRLVNEKIRGRYGGGEIE